MEKKDILTVPLSAVTTREPEDAEKKEANSGTSDEDQEEDGELDEVVFVVEDGVAKKIKVKTGISDFDNIEILSGITEGQEVITGPFLEVSKSLEDGTGVKVDSSEEEESE